MKCNFKRNALNVLVCAVLVSPIFSSISFAKNINVQSSEYNKIFQSGGEYIYQGTGNEVMTFADGVLSAWEGAKITFDNIKKIESANESKSYTIGAFNEAAVKFEGVKEIKAKAKSNALASMHSSSIAIKDASNIDIATVDGRALSVSSYDVDRKGIIDIESAGNISIASNSADALTPAIYLDGNTSVSLSSLTGVVRVSGNVAIGANSSANAVKGSSISIKAGEIFIEGDRYAIYNSGNWDTIELKGTGNSSKTYITGALDAGPGTVRICDQSVYLLSGFFFAQTVESKNGKIIYNENTSSIRVLGAINKNIDDYLIIAQSSDLTDYYGSAEEALDVAKDIVSVGDEESKYYLAGEVGTVHDGWIFKNGVMEIQKRPEPEDDESDDGDGDGDEDKNTDGDEDNTPQQPDSGGSSDNGLEIITNPSMQVLSNFNAMTLSQWRYENNHISERLGDVRGNLGQAGAWARVYGSESKLRDTVTTMKTKMRSVQVGSDVTVGKNWIVGAAFSYTNLDSDFSNGSGDSDSYSLAAYLSGFFDCGGYFDLVGRVGRLSADVKASTLSEAGGVFKGSYDNTAFGLSAEVGYRLPFAKTFYVEPQAELAYGYVLGDRYYSASNGVTMDQDDFQSLVGRLGARLGATFAEGAGSIYLAASVNHDFLGDADATATPAEGASRRLERDLGGTWFSYGIGAQFNPTENLSFYGKLARSNGDEYQEDYKFTVGARYEF